MFISSCEVMYLKFILKLMILFLSEEKFVLLTPFALCLLELKKKFHCFEN
jgi:hypothetical protein